jgi:hypothetical protein
LSELIYLPLLAVALGADVAAFYQVVSLVMAESTDEMIMLLVAGLTATAVTLAHFAGHFARDLAAEHGAATKGIVILCVVAWGLLGLAAVVVRAVVAQDTSDGLGPSAFGAGGTGATDQYVAAGLFAALYFASGAVAGIGAFIARNPLRAAYRKARRRYRKAVLRLRKSEPPFERAKHVYELHRTGLRRDAASYRAARLKRLAFAEELKEYSAVLIAAHLQNPSATDGMTEEDWRPMRPRPNAPPGPDDPPPEGSPPDGVPPGDDRQRPVPPASPLPQPVNLSPHNHANGS